MGGWIYFTEWGGGYIFYIVRVDIFYRVGGWIYILHSGGGYILQSGGVDIFYRVGGWIYFTEWGVDIFYRVGGVDIFYREGWIYIFAIPYNAKFSRPTMFADWRSQKFRGNNFRGPRISIASIRQLGFGM